MSHDGLFQLGMDLDRRSSTAQTEDKFAPCERSGNPESRKDYFCSEHGLRFAGRHLLVDLVGAERLDDLTFIDATLRRAVKAAGATLLHIHLHHFTPNGGISGVAVLAESHISIHSWPEHGYAALDIFMCGNTQPRKAVSVMKRAFRPERIIVKELLRGEESEIWPVGSTKRCTPIGVSA